MEKRDSGTDGSVYSDVQDANNLGKDMSIHDSRNGPDMGEIDMGKMDVGGAYPRFHLAFTDLISGPAKGLGDGKGSGAIVTIWGFGLGEEQGNSEIVFKDSSGLELNPDVYYWKKANGEKPGGPANLWASHRMYEIAISIPAAANGPGEIYLKIGGEESNRLPFSIREGNIYHVKKTGKDANGGSYDSPFKTVGKAISVAGAGSTIYLHDGVQSGGKGEFRGIYWNNQEASSTLEAQFSIISFPDSRALVQGQRGISNYKTKGFVTSKLMIRSSDCDDKNGQPENCVRGSRGKLTFGLQSSAFGRGVGNTITDEEGRCANAQSGAITGNNISKNSDRVSSYKIFGNEIYDYGCAGTSKFHHTTYMSVRDRDEGVVSPWEFGWNYLHDNKTKNGIHQFDEDLQKEKKCGDINDTIKIHDNVVVNQAGAGISIISHCGWTNDTEIYGNVLINVGLVSGWDGLDVNSTDGSAPAGILMGGHDYRGEVRVWDNIIYQWNADDLKNGPKSCLGTIGSGTAIAIKWDDNICYTDLDMRFEGFGYQAKPILDKIRGNGNTFYYSGKNPENAIPPSWDANPILEKPDLVVEGNYMRRK